MIDLHNHTSASDGRLSPTETVRTAAEAGVSVLAVTDHNLTDGIDEAMAAGKRYGVTVIPGIEINTALPRQCDGVVTHHGSMHLLGLFIDHRDQGLADLLSRERDRVMERNLKLSAALVKAGIPFDHETVAAMPSANPPQLFHYEKLLVEMGVRSTRTEARKDLVGPGGACHVPFSRVNPALAIQAIHEAGGLAVMAHPFTLGLDDAALFQAFSDLKGRGLDGVETVYPRHDVVRMRTWSAMAERLGLLVSGGTDFHGRPEHHPIDPRGFGPDGKPIPDRLLEAMTDRLFAARRHQAA